MSYSAVDRKASFKTGVAFELLSSPAEINDRDTAAEATQATPSFPHLPAPIRLFIYRTEWLLKGVELRRLECRVRLVWCFVAGHG